MSHADESLTPDDWRALVQSVFRPRPADRRLLLVTDLPDADGPPDRSAWRRRRELVARWSADLRDAFADDRSDDSLEVALLVYRNVRANNADLPATGWRWPLGAPLPDSADALDPSVAVDLHEELRAAHLVLAPTELSTTAPMKLLAPRLGFRAATMPGFREDMLGALRLDYDAIDRSVRRLAELLTRAEAAEIVFHIDPGSAGEATHSLTLDLRHRRGHASGGLVREVGTAGNLPSGEAYIVPYEGERDDDPSRSAGMLPVQLDEELLLYRIDRNRAVEVASVGLCSDGEGSATASETTSGPRWAEEQRLLATEPGYANLAELGLGVLGEQGIEPIGATLLDEKLGLHIAFGRSDHFGGTVGAKDFTSPAAVVHIDRVYLPSLQPRVRVDSVDLVIDEVSTPLMRDGLYVIDL